MERMHHKTNNGVLAPPPGSSPEECVALPVTNVLFADNQRGRITYWRPNVQELAMMAAGAPVRLCVLGSVHPPVHLGVEGDGFGQIDGVDL